MCGDDARWMVVGTVMKLYTPESLPVVEDYKLILLVPVSETALSEDSTTIPNTLCGLGGCAFLKNHEGSKHAWEQQ